ncbi:glycerol-3-phosphate acyltransferase [Candidatus Woesearchaeota archaeon]|nr:glycerol-3-phosphate acyltransferase [Candidatus Woesearchaeota archaeon]
MLAFAAAAYLMGSLNFAHLAGRLKGVDLRASGRFRNYGASNARSVLGWKWGFAVASLEIVKGAVAVALPVFLSVEWVAYVCAVLVVAGHRFPFYLGFRGGKGVASGSGAFGLLLAHYRSPAAALAALAFFIYAMAVSPMFRSRLILLIRRLA